MTTENTWAPQPINRIRHCWRCTRTGPVVETIRADTAGQPHLVQLCTECVQYDLVAWLRADAERKPT